MPCRIGSRQGNAIALRMLESAGVLGLWDENGPTEEGQRLFAEGPRSATLTPGQRTLLRLAFYSWGRVSDVVVTMADVLELDASTMKIAIVFLAAWSLPESGSARVPRLSFAARAARKGRAK